MSKAFFRPAPSPPICCVVKRVPVMCLFTLEHLSCSGIAVPVSSAHPAVFRHPFAAAGLRCILDFLREEDAATAQKILAEPPMYREGYAAHQIDVHPGQLDYLEETHGVKVGGAAGAPTPTRSGGGR